jgi:hypothetical protein
MNFFLIMLLSLFNLSKSYACNISENELIIRTAIMRANQARQSQLNLIGREKPDDEKTSNISKKEFLKIIDRVKKVYVPIFRDLDLNLKIEYLWEDRQLNAFAAMSGSDRYILLYGGYARHKFMTYDSYLSIVCHEIGHHLGGFPKKINSSWSSSEGQADYFSTLKCMKEVLESDSGNSSSAAALDLPEEIKSMCRKQYTDNNQYNICLRSSKAAEDYGKAIADILMPGSGNTISLMTPSAEMTFVTNLRHPKVQCRVDTKFQGALCNASPLVSLDDEDEIMGTCHLNNFNIIGNRPACWFVHSK